MCMFMWCVCLFVFIYVCTCACAHVRLFVWSGTKVQITGNGVNEINSNRYLFIFLTHGRTSVLTLGRALDEFSVGRFSAKHGL